jgi:hypothetical protein
VAIGKIDDVFQFARRSGETIDMAADDCIDGTGLHVLEQALLLRHGAPE